MHFSALHNLASMRCKREKADTENAFDVPSTLGANAGSKKFLDKCSPKISSNRAKLISKANLILFFCVGAAKESDFGSD